MKNRRGGANPRRDIGLSYAQFYLGSHFPSGALAAHLSEKMNHLKYVHSGSKMALEHRFLKHRVLLFSVSQKNLPESGAHKTHFLDTFT